MPGLIIIKNLAVTGSTVSNKAQITLTFSDPIKNVGNF